MSWVAFYCAETDRIFWSTNDANMRLHSKQALLEAFMCAKRVSFDGTMAA